MDRAHPRITRTHPKTTSAHPQMPSRDVLHRVCATTLHSENSRAESFTERYSSQFKNNYTAKMWSGLVCKAHGVLYRSALGSTVMKITWPWSPAARKTRTADARCRRGTSCGSTQNTSWSAVSRSYLRGWEDVLCLGEVPLQGGSSQPRGRTMVRRVQEVPESSMELLEVPVLLLCLSTTRACQTVVPLTLDR